MILIFLNEIIACFHFALIFFFWTIRYVLHIQRRTANTPHNPLQSVFFTKKLVKIS